MIETRWICLSALIVVILTLAIFGFDFAQLYALLWTAAITITVLTAILLGMKEIVRRQLSSSSPSTDQQVSDQVTEGDSDPGSPKKVRFSQERDEQDGDIQENQIKLDDETTEDQVELETSQRHRDINLILVGSQGHGKSATGNSLLRRNEFESDKSDDTVTTSISSGASKYKDWEIKVVDSPPPDDTTLSYAEGLTQFVSAMEKAMAECPGGVDAVLYVIKYGHPFTEDDQDVLNNVKAVFGDAIIREHTVVVVTDGESFDLLLQQDPTLTFEEWCAQHKGGFGDLISECNNRILLFSNVNCEEDTRNAQLDKLIKTVHDLRSQHGRYTRACFDGASISRNQ